MNNNQQKSISIIIQETQTKIIKILEESGLHISIIDLILKDLYQDISTQAVQVAQRELYEYQKAQQEE